MHGKRWGSLRLPLQRPPQPFLAHRRVDERRGYAPVPQRFLDHEDVARAAIEVGPEGVAEAVSGRGPGDPGPFNPLPISALNMARREAATVNSDEQRS